MKGQSSTELLILIGALLLIFVSLLGVFEQNLAQKSSDQRIFQVQEVALYVQNEINIAASARDGYQRSFEIPQKVIGKDYNITIAEEQIYIHTLDGKIALAIPTQNIVGEIQIGQNVIRKVNGNILLNQ